MCITWIVLWITLADDSLALCSGPPRQRTNRAVATLSGRCARRPTRVYFVHTDAPKCGYPCVVHPALTLQFHVKHGYPHRIPLAGHRASKSMGAWPVHQQAVRGPFARSDDPLRGHGAGPGVVRRGVDVARASRTPCGTRLRQGDSTPLQPTTDALGRAGRGWRASARPDRGEPQLCMQPDPAERST